jgi:hypothetical protein
VFLRKTNVHKYLVTYNTYYCCQWMLYKQLF